MELFALSSDFAAMLLRFVVCVFVNWLIIYHLYYKKCHRRDFSFTFMIMTVAIFFLVYFMMSMDRGKATMGVGLGLFGIFSIMRYRTDTMPVREMTYLFVIICLAVVHAMAGNMDETPIEMEELDDIMGFMTPLIIVDIIVVFVIWMCEKSLKFEASKLVQYDRMELIKPERYNEMVEDLTERLGLKITHVEVGGVDMLRDMAVLRVYYENEKHTFNTVDNMVKVPKMK